MGGVYTMVYAAAMVPLTVPVKTVDDPPVFIDTVQLPVIIPDTSLVAERIVCYDGHYVEDGSEDVVSGIAALYLHNSGDTMVASCRVIIRLEDGLYRFEATCIPPGSTVLVLEKSRRPYFDMGIYSVGGRASKGNKKDLHDSLHIEGFMGGLRIQNISESDYDSLCICHKNYDPVNNIYIGGVTYVTYADSLAPGAYADIWPVHFGDESGIVCITGKIKDAQ
jgi:hypothetical protein